MSKVPTETGICQQWPVTKIGKSTALTDLYYFHDDQSGLCAFL